MTRGNYEKEILECLAQNKGCIVGFRELARRGKFKNSNMLRKHLSQLIDKGMIIENKKDDKKQFCIIDDYDFHEGYRRVKHDLERLETLLLRKDLGPSSKIKIVTEIVKLANHHIKNIQAYLLHASTVENNEKKVRTYEKQRDAIINNLTRVIMKLKTKEDRERVINLMFESEGFLDFEQFKKDVTELAKKEKSMKKKIDIRFHGK